MYKHIARDFFCGITNSIRFDLYVKALMNNQRLQKLTFKIIKYNTLMHFLPYILSYLFYRYTGLNFMFILDILIYPINIFSILFHLLHYIDLVNMVCIYSSKNFRIDNTENGLTLAITMFIYQLVIYLTTSIISIIFNGRMHMIAILINFTILTIYHSFYCFNNLWQYKKVGMFHRIDMHEKLWPYYVGYGIFTTIIYLHIKNPIMLGIYNLYMVLLISVPFMIKTRYPNSVMSYPKINLKIFSYMTSLTLDVTKFIIRNIFRMSSN
jgi:hypothetical protein